MIVLTTVCSCVTTLVDAGAVTVAVVVDGPAIAVPVLAAGVVLEVVAKPDAAGDEPAGTPGWPLLSLPTGDPPVG